MIRILSIAFVLYEKYMSVTNREDERRAEGIICLVHLLKFESDTATSKNIAIIWFTKIYYNLLLSNFDCRFRPILPKNYHITKFVVQIFSG